MATITMTSNEPLKIIKLMEQLFNLQLDTMAKMLQDINMSGEISFSKKIDADIVTVNVIVNPEPAKK